MKKIYEEEVIKLVNNLIAKDYDVVIQDEEMHDKICHAVDLKEKAELDGDKSLLALLEKAFEIYKSDEFEEYFVKNYTNFNSVEEYHQSLDIFPDDDSPYMPDGDYGIDEDDDEDNPYNIEDDDLIGGMPSRCFGCDGWSCDIRRSFVDILNEDDNDYDCPRGFLLSLAEKNAKAIAEERAWEDRYYGLK